MLSSTEVNNLRVVTSCRGRFHIFDQARELARRHVLHQLITDYPKAWPVRFDIPPEKIHSLLISGFINHGIGRIRRYFPKEYQVKTDRWIHDNFSRQLAKLIPADTQYFIGLSSFCFEALQACREKGIPCAVDHGSFHLRENRRLVDEEAVRWGMPMVKGLASDWIVEKEDREFHAAEHVFALSGAARESMVRGGVPAEKIIVNPCGVDLDQFYVDEKKDDIFRIIQVGNIVLGKGVLTLLDAFASARLKRAELWLVGGGLDSSGLQSAITRMRTGGVTLHQPVHQAHLRKYYNQSSVFVLASVADGFGMVVPQAMACGLPVIVTENVGAKDLIVDGVNGFIVPVGAPEIIADRLRQLRADPEGCRAMGAAAKLTVENGNTWHEYGDRLLNFLQTRVST